MNSNFLRKFLMLILFAAGWANSSWAQVAELVNNSTGETKQYDSFQSAVSDIKEDNLTLKLLKDCTVDNIIAFRTNLSTILDLNGYTLNAQVIWLTGTTKLTIQDTRYTPSGYIGKIVTSHISYVFYLMGSSTLTIEGGIFKSSDPKAAAFDIEGSTDNVRLTIKNTYNGAKSYIYNTNGLLATSSETASDLFDIQDGYFSSTKGIEESYLKKGCALYKVRPNADCPYGLIKKSTVAVTVEDNGDVRATYDDIQSAFSGAGTGYSTVRLIKDVASGLVYIGNNTSLTFDLNGNTVSNADIRLDETNTNNVTIVDNSEGKTGKITSAQSNIFMLYSGSTLTINDGTFINNNSDNYYTNGCIAFLQENTTFNVYGGKFAYVHNFLSRHYASNTVNVYGGYFNKDTYEQDEALSWTSHLKSDFTAVGNSGVEDFPYTMAPIGAKLTYGESTVNAPIQNGMTIDLKDDDSDYSAWLSKIEMMQRDESAGIDFTIKKNFANNNWYAFCAPFDFTVSADLLENFEFAEIWDTELNTSDNSTSIEFIKLDEGATISAYTPCLIKANTTGKQDIVFKGVTPLANATKSIDCSSTRQKFTFTGVMENTNINGKYALDSENNGLVYVDNADAEVTPLKFYMEVEDRNSGVSVQGMKVAMRVIGDETTGINNITGNATETTIMGDVYNLQGVKVATSTEGLPAGIYIQNGKKLMVK